VKLKTGSDAYSSACARFLGADTLLLYLGLQRARGFAWWALSLLLFIWDEWGVMVMVYVFFTFSEVTLMMECKRAMIENKSL
jgi:hypothetical protein